MRLWLRDTRVLLRQFGGSLVAFGIALIGGGTLYWALGGVAQVQHPATVHERGALAPRREGRIAPDR